MKKKLISFGFMLAALLGVALLLSGETASAARQNVPYVCERIIRIAARGRLHDGRTFVSIEYALAGNDYGRRYDHDGQWWTDPIAESGSVLRSESNCTNRNPDHAALWNGQSINFGNSTYDSLFWYNFLAVNGRIPRGDLRPAELRIGVPASHSYTPSSENDYCGANGIGASDRRTAPGGRYWRDYLGIEKCAGDKVFGSINDSALAYSNNTTLWCVGMAFSFTEDIPECRDVDAADVYRYGGDLAGYLSLANTRSRDNMDGRVRTAYDNNANIHNIVGYNGTTDTSISLILWVQNTRDGIPVVWANACDDEFPQHNPCRPPNMPNNIDKNIKGSTIFTMILEEPAADPSIPTFGCGIGTQRLSLTIPQSEALGGNSPYKLSAATHWNAYSWVNASKQISFGGGRRLEPGTYRVRAIAADNHWTHRPAPGGIDSPLGYRQKLESFYVQLDPREPHNAGDAHSVARSLTPNSTPDEKTNNSGQPYTNYPNFSDGYDFIGEMRHTSSYTGSGTYDGYATQYLPSSLNFDQGVDLGTVVIDPEYYRNRGPSEYPSSLLVRHITHVNPSVPGYGDIPPASRQPESVMVWKIVIECSDVSTAYTVTPSVTLSETEAEPGTTVTATYTVCNDAASPPLTGVRLQAVPPNGVLPAYDQANHNLTAGGDCESVNRTSSQIPVNAPPGTLYCVTVRAYPPANPPNGSSGPESQACVTVISKPYLRAYNGDVIAGVGFGEGCTQNSDAKIVGYNSTGGRGASVQFAAQAFAEVDGFTSATGRTSDPQPDKGLTLANTGSSAFGGNFGAAHCLPNYAGSRPDMTAVNSGTVNIGALTGTHYYNPGGNGNGTLVINTAGGQVNNKVVLYVDGDVVIRTNGPSEGVTYANPNGWTTGPNGEPVIPAFYLIVSGDIFIDKSISRLDGVYIAQSASDGSGGTIYTCYDAANSELATAANLLNLCNSKLTVYGSLVANQVKFLRANGTMQRSSNGEPYTSPTIAEAIIYSPDIWINNPLPSTTSSTTGAYDSISSLPPVF